MKAKILLLILLSGAAGLFNAPVSSANDWDKASLIVFKNPTEIPGQVLPAGMYVFKLLDDDFNRHIVQIWNAEQTRLVATVAATTRVLLEADPADRLIQLEDRGKGQPAALKVWFHPGNYYGEEFNYSHKKK